MEEFYPFFIIIFAGVFFSAASRRLHVPWVVGLILGGMLIGPYGLGFLNITPTISFLGQVGLIFLMFMAGLETRSSTFRGHKGGLLWLSFINGAVPFIAGFAIAYLFGYSIISSLLVGIIFVSSSIAVVIPSLERNNFIESKLGQSVVMTTMIQDIASLVMLSVLLQNHSPITSLPLYIFYPLVVALLFTLKFFLPKIISLLKSNAKDREDVFQQEFRATFLILLGTVVAFELLGLHPIIAGFFAGLILANNVKSEVLKEKIHTIGYGIFVPTFFVIIGSQTDISILFQSSTIIIFVSVVILGSVLSKFLSGWVGGKMVGFTNDESLLFAITSIPQLSTTLAVAFTALSLGLIDQKLVTALVTLSIVTVVVSPTLMNIFSTRIEKSIEARRAI